MDKIFSAITPKNREISDYLHNYLIANSSLGTYKAIETAIDKTVSQFELIPNLEISMGVLSQGVMYLGAYGGGRVRIQRHGTSQNVLETLKGQKLTASGHHQKNDKFHFETQDHHEIFERKSIIERFFKKPKVIIALPEEFERQSRGKKTTLLVGIILLLILGVSIFFGIRQKNVKEIRSKYEGVLTEASRQLDEAIGLSSVSPDKARELFVSAQEKLASIESLNVKDPKISELREKIETEKSNAFGEYKVSTDLYLDLGLLSSGFDGSKLSSTQGNLYILDKDGKKVAKVELENKRSSIATNLDNVINLKSFSSYSDKVYVLDGQEIKEAEEGAKVVISKEDLPIDEDGEAFIFAFAGNVYVLDKKENKIYRYQGTGGSFGGRQDWLSESTKPDFSNAKSWIIDGSVYVLESNGRIQKFSQGSAQTFNLTGVFPEVTEIEDIYSSDETEFFYILDKVGKRVVVTDKKGTYKAQYMADEIGNAIDLAVSEKEKKIILLTGGKLLEIGLRD